MAIRHDPDRIEETLDISAHKDKLAIRIAILLQWSEEKEGEKYRYFVHTFADGTRLYLERPARLNKGCDFVIFLENENLAQNGNDKPPSHKDLWNDLAVKKQKLTADNWRALYQAIACVHAVRPYEISPATCKAIDSVTGLSAEKILRLCEWFFIEQDITYWSGTGRNMLFESLTEINSG